MKQWPNLNEFAYDGGFGESYTFGLVCRIIATCKGLKRVVFPIVGFHSIEMFYWLTSKVCEHYETLEEVDVGDGSNFIKAVIQSRKQFLKCVLLLAAPRCLPRLGSSSSVLEWFPPELLRKLVTEFLGNRPPCTIVCLGRRGGYILNSKEMDKYLRT